MIKTLWFFIKVAVFIGASIWLISQPGEMGFNFLGYDVQIQTGVFLLVLAFLVLAALYVLRFINAVFSVPKVVAEYRDEYRYKIGYRSLTRGLVAVAAGDANKATQYSKETTKLLKDQTGLPLLLEAQAARLRGDEGVAKERFEQLLENKDMAFLGIRGLMKSAVEEGNVEQALEYARSALKLHPNQAWILKMVYALEIKSNHWEEALKLAPRVERSGAVSAQKIKSDRIAIHLMRHDYYHGQGEENAAFRELKAAYKLDSAFVPTVTRFAEHYIKAKKNKKAAALIEGAWKVNPHPELAEIWDRLSPQSGKNLNTKKLAWFEKLVEWDGNSAEAHIAVAKAAMQLEFWGEAKAHLIAAEKLYPTAQVFHMRTIVEQNITHNDDKVEDVLEKASTAMPHKVWTCQETGMVYDQWSAISMPHESFNTIVWDVPSAHIVDGAFSMLHANDSGLLIDPAA